VDEVKKLFNLDQWYGVTLFIGILCIVAPFFKDIVFVNQKHLVGLGIGLIILSIAYIKANRYMNRIENGHIIQWRQTIHDTFTKILVLIGVALTTLFLGLIIYSLI
jgi:hypothetical protein